MIYSISNFTYISLLNISLLLILPAVIFVTWRLSIKESIIIKVQYLSIIIITVSLVLIDMNINFIIPIYIMIETGTLLFILITTRGFSNIFTQKKILYNGFFKVAIIPLSILFIYYINNIDASTQNKLIYLDIFTKDTVNNEFLM